MSIVDTSCATLGVIFIRMNDRMKFLYNADLVRYGYIFHKHGLLPCTHRHYFAPCPDEHSSYSQNNRGSKNTHSNIFNEHRTRTNGEKTVGTTHDKVDS